MTNHLFYTKQNRINVVFNKIIIYKPVLKTVTCFCRIDFLWMLLYQFRLNRKQFSVFFSRMGTELFSITLLAGFVQ